MGLRPHVLIDSLPLPLHSITDVEEVQSIKFYVSYTKRKVYSNRFRRCDVGTTPIVQYITHCVCYLQSYQHDRVTWLLSQHSIQHITWFQSKSVLRSRRWQSKQLILVAQNIATITSSCCLATWVRVTSTTLTWLYVGPTGTVEFTLDQPHTHMLPIWCFKRHSVAIYWGCKYGYTLVHFLRMHIQSLGVLQVVPLQFTGVAFFHMKCAVIRWNSFISLVVIEIVNLLQAARQFCLRTRLLLGRRVTLGELCFPLYTLPPLFFHLLRCVSLEAVVRHLVPFSWISSHYWELEQQPALVTEKRERENSKQLSKQCLHYWLTHAQQWVDFVWGLYPT